MLCTGWRVDEVLQASGNAACRSVFLDRRLLDVPIRSSTEVHRMCTLSRVGNVSEHSKQGN